MTTVKSKSTRKRIKTILTVKLMEGKTGRDMYREFFRDRPLKVLDEKNITTQVTLRGELVSYDLYKMFSGIGASREFLESFEFEYYYTYKIVDSSLMVSKIYEVVPFLSVTGVSSTITGYTLGAHFLDSTNDLQIEIETYSWKDFITADELKRINKENARKFRHYLVGLPSVQGVPYTCNFREDEISELECSV